MLDIFLGVVFLISIFTYIFWGLLGIMPERPVKLGYTPTMSVIMPAHDEVRVIRSTIQSVLDAKYPGDLEIIVVNDGSNDATGEIVSAMSKEDARVKRIDTSHLGKAMAVNRGVEESKGEIMVFLDADSALDADALLLLAEPFQDPMVGAVSGIIQVVPTLNPLAWYQEFEYILSSMWRYIFDKLGCTYVLPGFVAFRRKALAAADGFETDTLCEDFDIGLKMHKTDYRPIMSKAIMFTNVPQTLMGLAKQRLRWGHGTVQVLRKHRDMILNPTYGFIGLYGLPNQIYFLVQSAVILPITFYQIFSGYLKWFVSYGIYMSWEVLTYFIAYFSMFGTARYVFKVYTGVWEADWLFPLFLYSFLFNQAYGILSIMRLGRLNYRIVFAMIFLFPYYLFTLVFFIYPLIVELSPFRSGGGHVNIWEKNK